MSGILSERLNTVTPADIQSALAGLSLKPPVLTRQHVQCVLFSEGDCPYKNWRRQYCGLCVPAGKDHRKIRRALEGLAAVQSVGTVTLDDLCRRTTLKLEPGCVEFPMTSSVVVFLDHDGRRPPDRRIIISDQPTRIY